MMIYQFPFLVLVVLANLCYKLHESKSPKLIRAMADVDLAFAAITSSCSMAVEITLWVVRAKSLILNVNAAWEIELLLMATQGR